MNEQFMAERVALLERANEEADSPVTMSHFKKIYQALPDEEKIPSFAFIPARFGAKIC